MNVMKRLRTFGMTVALASVITLVVPVTMSASASTTMVSAATMKLSAKKLTLVIGKSKTLKVTGTKSSVKWSSSDKTVATVSSKGKVTAKTRGTATITAKVGSKKMTCKVTTKSFEEDTLTFNNGVNFIIPKGWYNVDVPTTGMERKLLALSDQVSSYIDLRVIPTDPISNEDFTASIKEEMTAEKQEANLEKSYLEQGLNLDLTISFTSQIDYLVENKVVVLTIIEYGLDGVPAIQATVYDIYDGTYIYELVAMNYYDTNINYVGYLSYIAENITVEE